MSLDKLKSFKGGFVKTNKSKNKEYFEYQQQEHSKKKNKHHKEKRKYIDDFDQDDETINE